MISASWQDLKHLIPYSLFACLYKYKQPEHIKQADVINNVNQCYFRYLIQKHL